ANHALSLHDALPIYDVHRVAQVATELLDKSVRVRKHGEAVRAGSDRLLEGLGGFRIDLHNEARRAIEQIAAQVDLTGTIERAERSEEHTSELQSREK